MDARVRHAIALLSVTAAVGCASTARNDAVALAASGAKVADSARATLSDTSAALDRYVEGQYLEAAVSGKPSPSDEELASIANVQTAIGLREQALRNLSELYGSLAALGQYDAKAEAEGAAKGLTDSINELGVTLGSKKPALSNVEAGFIDRGAGLFAAWTQDRAIRAASPAIRERLERFRELLKLESDTFASLRTVIANARSRTAKKLFDKGLGNPAPVMRDVLESYGLPATDKDGAAALAKLGEPGREAIGEIIKFRSDVAARRVSSVVCRSLSERGIRDSRSQGFGGVAGGFRSAARHFS